MLPSIIDAAERDPDVARMHARLHADFMAPLYTVITRAQEILSGLERDELSRGGRPTLSGDGGDPGTRQLGLFASTPEPSSPQQRQIAERLKAIDVDETTPRQALELLAELKKLSDECKD